MCNPMIYLNGVSKPPPLRCCIWPVTTTSRSRWRHSMRQTSSVWGPVFVLYSFWILLATGIGSPGGVGQFFTNRHSGTSRKYLLLRWHIIWARMTYRHCQFMSSRLPGSLKQTRGSGCLSWQPNDSARFRLRRILWPRFILSLLVLMQSNFYNLKTYLVVKSQSSGKLWCT